MSQAFSEISKVAIESMVDKHLTDAKYGYFLTKTSRHELIQEIVGFLEMSRSLQARGEAFIRGPVPPASIPAKRSLSRPR